MASRIYLWKCFEGSTHDDPVELSCGSLDVGSSKGSGFSAWRGQLDAVTPPAVYGFRRTFHNSWAEDTVFLEISVSCVCLGQDTVVCRVLMFVVVLDGQPCEVNQLCYSSWLQMCQEIRSSCDVVSTASESVLSGLGRSTSPEPLCHVYSIDIWVHTKNLSKNPKDSLYISPHCSLYQHLVLVWCICKPRSIH